MAAETCGTCRFVRTKGGERQHVCCLNPPAVKKVGESHWPWPKVMPDEDWCGSYEASK